jgi:hypothetical protein
MQIFRQKCKFKPPTHFSLHVKQRRPQPVDSKFQQKKFHENNCSKIHFTTPYQVHASIFCVAFCSAQASLPIWICFPLIFLKNSSFVISQKKTLLFPAMFLLKMKVS